MDPADSSHVFYGANGVWRTLDGGSTWSGPSGPETYALAVNGSTVYAGTWQVVSISRDFGDSWTDAFLPASDDDNPTVTALAIDPERPERIFAGTSGGYLWRSSDNGASWDLVWSRHYDGITSIVLDAFDQRLVHVGTTYTGPSPMHFAISSPHLRSADGGTNWTESFLPAELGAGGFDALVLDPSHPGVLYAGSDGGVYRSVDHGETWRSIGDVGRVTSLAGSGSALYAGTFGGAFAADISGLPAPCSGGPFALCLNSGRFQVRASWQGSPDGPTVEATPVPLTADTGAFWFFTPSNVELVVKVLDGRPVNGHFWVFVGGLSSVQYSIEVTDTETGEVWTHDHASGGLESFADTAAF
jgi:hypothetical protein